MIRRGENGGCSHRGLNRVILDCVADGVFTVDRDFRITSFNRAAERISGVPREEALGRRCSDVFRTEHCEERCVLRETIRTGTPVVNRAVHIVKPDGEQTTAREWAEELEIFYAPSIVFFDERGREIIRVDSVVNFFRLRNVLNYVVSRGYLTEPNFLRWSSRTRRLLEDPYQGQNAAR